MAAGVILNAVFQCLYVIFGWRWVSAAGYLVMTGIAFEPGTWGRGIFFLMVSVLCFGGTVEALLTMVPLGMIAASLVSWILLRGIWRWYQKSRRKMEREVPLLLTWKEKTIEAVALVDTGNRLREPASGRPVSILEKDSARELLGSGWEERKGFLLIPYHSIGRDLGWMQGVVLDRMIILTPEGECQVKNPVFAISSGSVSRNHQYQVILHEEHLKSCPKRCPSKTGMWLERRK